MPAADRSAPAAWWRRALSLWGPPAIYALAIFGSSSLHAAPSTPLPFTDKHVHLIAYAGLALVVVRALSGGRWSGVTVATGLQAAIMTTAYGATDEWHQSLVPGRHADLLDVVADAVGAVLGAAVVVAVARWSRRGGNATIERVAGRIGQTP